MNADIEALGIERGHRTSVIIRKGGKVVTIPLAPRTVRATGLAIGERMEGPSSWRPMGGGWTGMAGLHLRGQALTDDPAPDSGGN